MKLFKAITGRRSIRKFKDKALDKDDLFLLVEAGMHAPSAGNLQDFKFIVTIKQDIINKTAELCMEQGWISTAKGLIVICSQPKKQKEWYGPKGDHIFAIQNASAAAQNILLAAHSIGLASCWVSGFDQQKIDNLFGTGSDARVEVILPIGYPNEKPEKRTLEEIDSMMFFDKYGNDKSNLLKLNKDYSAMIEKDLESLPTKTREIIEKGKYLFKKAIFDVKKMKKNK